MRASDHQPRVRPTSNADGTVCYEVCCAACGDDDGPFALQCPQVQRVRGPYKTMADAREAVVRHLAFTARDW